MGGKGSGRKPRNYPQEIVDLICGMYRDGMTVSEIRAAAPNGYRVQTILERYLPERRTTAKRNQRGPDNDMWRGFDAGYAAAHLRLGSIEGDCVDCSGRAREWSYVGCPDEVTDSRGRRYCHHTEHYQPRCRPCHHRYDYKGRRPNGQWLSREEVMPHV